MCVCVLFFLLYRTTQLLRLLQVRKPDEITSKLIEISDNTNSWTFNGE